MAKGKITSNDFLALLDEDEQSFQPVAFAPQKTEPKLEPTKKKHSIMDGYFNEPTAEVEITPLVAEMFTPQTDNKQVTNGHQSDNNPKEKETTNRQQTGNKRVTKKQADFKTDNKRVTKQVTEQITIEQQTGNKRITKCSFESLVGNEKNLLLLIFKECLRVGSLISPEITLAHIHESLEITPGVAKMAIYRLVKKGVIKRETSKTGRGGWIKFSIQKELYQDLRIRESDNKQITNGYQTDNKRVTKQVTEQITIAPCSSSNLNIKNTTTEEPLWINIPDSLKGRVSITQLQKLVSSGVIDQETLDDSLWGFAHDLEKNLVRSKTGNVMGVLFGSLRNGGYISSQYLDQKKAELQENQNRVEELRKVREKLEAQNLAEEFEEFRKTFPDKAEAFKPANGLVKSFETNSIGYKLWLDEYKKHKKEGEVQN